MRRYVHTTIKMTIALVITTLIAQSLNLDYAITAGILAVLFMQLTRKDSYVNAAKRILDGLLAIGLSTVFFLITGYNTATFFYFTIFFIALSFALKISVGIVPSLVLVSHLLIEGSFSWAMILNAVLLIGISASVAMMLNVLYPLNTYKYLSGYINAIDELLIRDIINLSVALTAPDKKQKHLDFHQDNRDNLKKILHKAELADKDIMFDKDHRHIAYLRMRHAQMNRIDRLFDLYEKLKRHHPHADILSEYVYELSGDIGKPDKATPQLDKLKELREDFRTKPLPETREAFETRAILFQMMFEIESLLHEKVRFHTEHPAFQ